MKKVILSQLILITSILISCTDKLENTEVNNNPTNQVVLTSNEYASIAYDNPKELSEDEITNVIYDFKRINSEFKKQFITTKEDKPKISIINKYYLTNSRNHSRSADSIQINVPIFEVELTNNSGTKDMIIVCGDERAPKKVCRNARCTSFLFITIQICSFSLSCDLLKISLIYVFPASKNSSCKLIKQSNQPVHTLFCQFYTHLFYIEGNG